MEPWEVDEVAKLLATIIGESKNYSYVDKLGYAPSKDLALFYLKEALRDFHSIKGFENKKAEELSRGIRFEIVDRALQKISSISDRKELREIVSLIAAKALSKSAELRGES